MPDRAGFLHVEVYVFVLILAFIGFGICSIIKGYIGAWTWWLWAILGLFSMPAAFFWLLVFPWVMVKGFMDWLAEKMEEK